MMAKFSPQKEILAFLNPLVSITAGFEQGTGETVDGRTIVKAGTVVGGGFTKDMNDTFAEIVTGEEGEVAEGVVLYDVDTTNKNASGAVLLHGFINTDLIDEVPEELQAQMPMIGFIANGKGGAQ